MQYQCFLSQISPNNLRLEFNFNFQYDNFILQKKLFIMTSPGIVCPSPVYSKPSPSCCPQSSLLYPQMTYPDALSCYPYSLMYNNLFMLQAAYSTPNKTSIRNYLPSYHDSSPILDLSARANSCSSPEVSSDDSFASGMIFFLL